MSDAEQKPAAPASQDDSGSAPQIPEALNHAAPKRESKEIREWVQLYVNIAAALGACLLFVFYGRQQKVIERQLGNINLELSEVQKDLTVMSREKSRIELDALKSTNVRVAKSLRSVEVRQQTGTARKVDFVFTLKNEGALPVEIRCVLIEAYTGRLRGRITRGVVVNAPAEKGVIHWERVQKRANFALERCRDRCFVESPDPNANPRRIEGVRGGGGTGRLTAGGSAQSGLTVYVPSSGVDLVAFYGMAILDEKTAIRFGMVDTAEAASTALHTE